MNPHPNVFASGGIHRAAERRHDEAWLEASLADPSTRVVPIWHAQNLVDDSEEPHAILVPIAEAEALLQHSNCIIFLGETEDGAYFAVDLNSDDPLQELELQGQFVDLHRLGVLLDHTEGALLAHARAMAYWHRRHRFCGECGSPTESREAGHLRACIKPDCGAQHFPRTDPAIIVLVESEGRCLLGRHANWPPTRYSVVAGFVEPGESLEDAVAREVMEETSIPVTNVAYHSSQPWPFPASIMLGFTAQATNDSITVDHTELEDARWFSRADLLAAIASGEVSLPSNVSISRRLVDDWLAADPPST
jgi:NAD+ diphosphatase